MTLTATNPVLDAVMALVATDTTLAQDAYVSGRVYGTPPEDVLMPYVWLDVTSEDDYLRGFGTGGLATVTLRARIVSRYDGVSQAHAVNQRLVQILKDAALTVSGYNQCGRIVYRETVAVTDELDGDRVSVVASEFTIWVEQQ